MRRSINEEEPGKDETVQLIARRTIVAGSLASLAVIRRAIAAPPTTIADGTPIGRGKMLVVQEDSSGRIVALDSSSYLGAHPTGPSDIIVVGSYCGTRILAPMFSRGVKAVIATDAAIGEDEAGMSGRHRDDVGGDVKRPFHAPGRDQSRECPGARSRRRARPCRLRGRHAPRLGATRQAHPNATCRCGSTHC